MNLDGRVAWITGGARIGRTVAEELARMGCDIALTYRNSSRSAEETAAQAEQIGARALVVKADLCSGGEIGSAVQAIDDHFGRIDILVNMASIYQKTPAASLDEAQWYASLDANLSSAYLTSLAVAPIMRRCGGGRMIHFSDWVAASRRPRYLQYLPYYTAKMGVIGLTEGLALELAPEILVNAIAPGPILAPDSLTAEEDLEVIKATPLRRWGGASEIARTVVFLIETDFITGECIRVDGGRHLS
ncbi:MAG: SDR family oxidoreductase [Acidobacteria bacterium]|nr:SDR family oxidoreductase [Acidobacteriota bacterium]